MGREGDRGSDVRWWAGDRGCSDGWVPAHAAGVDGSIADGGVSRRGLELRRLLTHLATTPDSPRRRAIESGQWVLLDNANLCNPTVLDRLNPLLEPRGQLVLNECGSAGGGPRVLVPHPDFRLFMAMDPRHGEVSRAMRNRGVEVFLLRGADATPSPADAQLLLEQAGIEAPDLQRGMCELHRTVTEMVQREYRWVSGGQCPHRTHAPRDEGRRGRECGYWHRGRGRSPGDGVCLPPPPLACACT